MPSLRTVVASTISDFLLVALIDSTGRTTQYLVPGTV